HRLGIQEQTIWGWLQELRRSLPRFERGTRQPGVVTDAEQREAPAPQREKVLLEILLAEPALVSEAVAHIAAVELEHPGLRQVLEGLYRLQEMGETPDLDHVRPLIENPRLAEYALSMEDTGRRMSDRPGALRQLLDEFRRRRLMAKKQVLQDQL